MNVFRSRVVAVVTGALVVVGLGTTSGYAAAMITSADIKDNTITAADVHTDTIRGNELADGTVRQADLSDRISNKLSAAGGISNVIAGAGYTHTWAGDQGAQLNTIIETCPDGQVALGGGYSTWGGSDVNAGGTPYDLGGDNKAVQVTVSAPYYEETYDPNKYGGNIRPTEWVVKGYNNSGTDQIVRAWVVCAD